MARGKKKRSEPEPVVETEPIVEESPSVDVEQGKCTESLTDTVPPDIEYDEDGDPDFSARFSNDSMTWMRKVMRVQAADVLKCEKGSGEIIVKKALQEVQKQFLVDITQLKSEMDSAIEKLKKQVGDLETKVANLQEENDRKSKQLRSMEFQNGKDKPKRKELTITIDELEQSQHKSSVQIVGLSESENEEADVKKVVKLAREKMNLKLKKTDVSDVHRLGKKCDGKARDLVIKFTDQKSRDQFHLNRKKTAPHKDPSKNIYVNDVLTTYRKGLFYAARKLFKSHKICAAWTQKGNVLVRKADGDQAMEVKCYDDLRQFQEKSYSSSFVHSESDMTSEDVLSHLSDYSY